MNIIKKAAKKSILFLITGLFFSLVLLSSSAAYADDDSGLVSVSFGYADHTISLYYDEPSVKPGDKIIAHISNETESKWIDCEVVNPHRIHVTVNLSDFTVSGEYEAYFYHKGSHSSVNDAIGHTTFTVPLFDTLEPEVTVDKASEETSSFRVSVKGLKSPFGINSVRITVSSDDCPKYNLTSYDAELSADGCYRVTVKVKNHGYYDGPYTIRVYATTGNGEETYFGKTNYEFTAYQNIIKVSDDENTAERTIYFDNPTAEPTSFILSTYTDEGKSTYELEFEKTAENIYKAAISYENYSTDGTYYIEIKSNKSGMGKVSFQWKPATIFATKNSDQQMFDLAQQFSSASQYLIMVDRSIHRVGIYQMTGSGLWREIYYWPCVVGAPDTPSLVGMYTITWRKPNFGTSEYLCWWATSFASGYYFHSQPYVPDSGPYVLQDATMDAAVSHGCVRLYIENALWIYENIPDGTTVYFYN